jgi:hypothetical protein
MKNLYSSKNGVMKSNEASFVHFMCRLVTLRSKATSRAYSAMTRRVTGNGNG